MELRLGDSPMGPVSLELCQVLMLRGTSGHTTSTDLTPYTENILGKGSQYATLPTCGDSNYAARLCI